MRQKTDKTAKQARAKKHVLHTRVNQKALEGLRQVEPGKKFSEVLRQAVVEYLSARGVTV